jgi:hypothetical protein
MRVFWECLSTQLCFRDLLSEISLMRTWRRSRCSKIIAKTKMTSTGTMTHYLAKIKSTTVFLSSISLINRITPSNLITKDTAKFPKRFLKCQKRNYLRNQMENPKIKRTSKEILRSTVSAIKQHRSIWISETSQNFSEKTAGMTIIRNG